MPKKATPDELKAAALTRAPRHVVNLSSYFTETGTRSASDGQILDHLVNPVRINESLATRVANWGNTNGHTYSDALRELIEAGLHAKENQQP